MQGVCAAIQRRGGRRCGVSLTDHNAADSSGADANFAGLLGKIKKFASDDSVLSVILPYLDRPVQQFFSLVMKEIFGHLFGRKIYCAKKVFLSVFGKGPNIIRTMVSTGVIVVALNHAIQRRKKRTL